MEKLAEGHFFQQKSPSNIVYTPASRCSQVLTEGRLLGGAVRSCRLPEDHSPGICANLYKFGHVIAEFWQFNKSKKKHDLFSPRTPEHKQSTSCHTKHANWSPRKPNLRDKATTYGPSKRSNLNGNLPFKWGVPFY